MVVVDVDRQRRVGEQAEILAEAVLVRAVERDEHPLRCVGGRFPPQLLEGHERILERERRVTIQVHRRVLAKRVQRELRGQDRAQRVAVGVLVRD